METKHPPHHSRSLFAFGILCIGLLLIVFTFVGDAFSRLNRTATPAAEEETTADAENGGDPLVTVVPTEVLGGKPQPLATDPKIGAANPTVTIVEFGDFQCEACKQLSAVFAQVRAAYPEDVLHVWKDFPIPALHEYSETAAVAARCADDQGAFWEYHDALYELQATFVLLPWEDIAQKTALDQETFHSCLVNQTPRQLVVQGYFVGRTLGIEETPAYYINDRLYTGVKSFEELTAIINDEITTAE